MCNYNIYSIYVKVEIFVAHLNDIVYVKEYCVKEIQSERL